jgi:lysozyme family protein
MYIDPIIQQPLRDAMRHEDPRWFTTGKPRIVDHPADRGTLTCGGITAKNWGHHKRLGRPATRAELAAITIEQALEFYYTRYVLGPRFDRIPDQKLRALCIDWSFTSWSDDPWKAVQKALRDQGYNPGPIDGAFGPKTNAALLACRDQRELYRNVFKQRVVFYVSLALNDRKVQGFMAANPDVQLWNVLGWLNRSLEYSL